MIRNYCSHFPNCLKNVFLWLVCLSQDPKKVYMLHLVVMSFSFLFYNISLLPFFSCHGYQVTQESRSSALQYAAKSSPVGAPQQGGLPAYSDHPSMWQRG